MFSTSSTTPLPSGPVLLGMDGMPRQRLACRVCRNARGPLIRALPAAWRTCVRRSPPRITALTCRITRPASPDRVMSPLTLLAVYPRGSLAFSSEVGAPRDVDWAPPPRSVGDPAVRPRIEPAGVGRLPAAVPRWLSRPAGLGRRHTCSRRHDCDVRPPDLHPASPVPCSAQSVCGG